jgi:hypothetical protein
VIEPSTSDRPSSGVATLQRSKYFSGMWTVRFCSWVLVLSSAANAAAPARCVVVRKPTAQQREESAADVERLLDDYEKKTSDNVAWPVALAEVFDRFPLPSVNMLMALHHPAWGTPENKLLAYVEATRQDPGDYAEPAAVAQTIERIKQNLLPEVRHWPLLIVEARGIARRQEIAKLDIHIDNQACTGNSISVGVAYSVSWVDKGRRLTANVTPQQLEDHEDRCLAIDRHAIGPCDKELSPVESPSTTRALPKVTPRPPKTHAPILSNHSEPTSNAPSIDYRLAVPGLALAVVGFGVAVYARRQVDVHMDRAEAGPDPKCHNGQCSQSGMADVMAARDYKTAYYAAGTAGLLGLGALLASGHRYYADWLFPPSKHVNEKGLLRSPSFVPIATARGAGLLLQSRF